MALVEAGPVPRGLEPFGNGQWRKNGDGLSLRNLFLFPQEVADGVTSVFDAWTNDGEADMRKFSYATDAIARETVVPCVKLYDQKKPPVGPDYALVERRGSAMRTPFSIRAHSYKFSDDPESLVIEQIAMHVTGSEASMTNEPEFQDARIPFTDEWGFFPDIRWTGRVLECAGFIAHQFTDYVRKAGANEGFLEQFLDKRVQHLGLLLSKHGLRVIPANGYGIHPKNNERVPFEGVALVQGTRRLILERMCQTTGVMSDEILNWKPYDKIAGVDFVSDIRGPFAELFHLGGANGPITELILPRRAPRNR